MNRNQKYFKVINQWNTFLDGLERFSRLGPCTEAYLYTNTDSTAAMATGWVFFEQFSTQDIHKGSLHATL